MNVLVDTSIWSLLLRRRDASRLTSRQKQAVDELKELIEEDRAFISGIIRQELLTGVRSRKEFNRLRERLGFFDDLPVNSATHELAAEIANRCLGKGVLAGTPYLLICATARQEGMAIFSLDKYFARIADHVDMPLHEPRDE